MCCFGVSVSRCMICVLLFFWNRCDAQAFSFCMSANGPVKQTSCCAQACAALKQVHVLLWVVGLAAVDVLWVLCSVLVLLCFCCCVPALVFLVALYSCCSLHVLVYVFCCSCCCPLTLCIFLLVVSCCWSVFPYACHGITVYFVVSLFCSLTYLCLSVSIPCCS